MAKPKMTAEGAAKTPPRGGAFAAYRFIDFATQGFCALVGLLVLVLHNHTVPRWPWFVGAHLLGLAAIHTLIQFHARHPGSKGIEFLRHYYPIPLYVVFFSENGFINRMVFPDFLDPVFIRWDEQLFGGDPSLAFMAALPYLVVSEIFYAAYFCYYVMIAGIGIALFLRNRRQFFHYLTVLSILFYVCFLIYDLLPVVGPPIFFPELQGVQLPAGVGPAVPPPYPQAIQGGPFFQIMAFIYRHFEGPGAAFPSSHVAAALCTVYFSFLYLPKIRWLHLAVAILLCLATVYCRYHYAVDVIAGLVTAALIIPLANRLYRKFGAE